MRRRGNPLQGVRSRTKQFDLFAEPVAEGQARMPEWQTLPAETRQALTNLMVRLILEHARDDSRPRQAEGRHDD